MKTLILQRFLLSFFFSITFLVEVEELQVQMTEVWEEEEDYLEEQEVEMEPPQEEEQEPDLVLLLLEDPPA